MNDTLLFQFQNILPYMLAFFLMFKAALFLMAKNIETI